MTSFKPAGSTKLLTNPIIVIPYDISEQISYIMAHWDIEWQWFHTVRRVIRASGQLEYWLEGLYIPKQDCQGIEVESDPMMQVDLLQEIKDSVSGDKDAANKIFKNLGARCHSHHKMDAKPSPQDHDQFSTNVGLAIQGGSTCPQIMLILNNKGEVFNQIHDPTLGIILENVPVVIDMPDVELVYVKDALEGKLTKKVVPPPEEKKTTSSMTTTMSWSGAGGTSTSTTGRSDPNPHQRGQAGGLSPTNGSTTTANSGKGSGSPGQGGSWSSGTGGFSSPVGNGGSQALRNEIARVEGKKVVGGSGSSDPQDWLENHLDTMGSPNVHGTTQKKTETSGSSSTATGAGSTAEGYKPLKRKEPSRRPAILDAALQPDSPLTKPPIFDEEAEWDQEVTELVEKINGSRKCEYEVGQLMMLLRDTVKDEHFNILHAMIFGSERRCMEAIGDLVDPDKGIDPALYIQEFQEKLRTDIVSPAQLMVLAIDTLELMTEDDTDTHPTVLVGIMRDFLEDRDRLDQNAKARLFQ